MKKERSRGRREMELKEVWNCNSIEIYEVKSTSTDYCKQIKKKEEKKRKG